MQPIRIRSHIKCLIQPLTREIGTSEINIISGGVPCKVIPSFKPYLIEACFNALFEKGVYANKGCDSELVFRNCVFDITELEGEINKAVNEGKISVCFEKPDTILTIKP